ncbi:MAG: nucleotidyl transferase AbiEii/AbiGii toxin family protein [Candidatus Gribaldobacteria bacterium]|nr:nucleotidyl transferase AbiEii/AbiGii toxin family protein [Candidatus Gribaldobacteria bacterium]
MKIEVLKSKQKEILPYLYSFAEFRLVGGTALALQLGHRTSVDFDLFTEKDLPKGLVTKVKRVFRGSKVLQSINLPEQQSLAVDGVKIDFVSHKFPFILEPLVFQKLKMAQISEIAVMKAFTLNFRGTYKDYVDLYFILKEGYSSLGQILEIGEKKYGDEFNFRLFLEQLLYIEETRRTEIEFLRGDVTEEEIKKFFKQEISQLKL